MALGTYEPHVVAALRQHIRPGDVAYDLGAHVGYMTLVLAHLVGASGQVFAFEANARNRAALERNVANNRWVRGATVVPLAVSDAVGTLTFATFGYSLVGHIAAHEEPADAQLNTMPATSLDHFIYHERHPAPNVIKIDVEGAEDRVLNGAARVLADARPVVICETRPDQTSGAVASLLARHGYTLRTLKAWGAVEDIIALPNI